MPRYSVFDIMGPIMIGPSSSHTAGAVRLGRMVRKIVGVQPSKVSIQLHGSFADTYQGHGTDLALVAGLLELPEDAVEITRSLELAAEQGLTVDFQLIDLGAEVHPNTARFICTLPEGRKIVILGHSTGGGSILISEINGYQLTLTGELYSLITNHRDEPGIVAAVTRILAEYSVNIAFLSLARTAKGEDALMTIQADEPIPVEACSQILEIKGVHGATVVPALNS